MVSGLIRAGQRPRAIGGDDAGRGTRAQIGVAPQNIALYPPITVREHLRLFGGLAGLRRQALRDARSTTRGGAAR